MASPATTSPMRTNQLRRIGAVIERANVVKNLFALWRELGMRRSGVAHAGARDQRNPLPCDGRRSRARALGQARLGGRALDLRLRVADVGPRLSLLRGGAGAAARPSPQLLRLFARPSRHARRARPGAGAGPRRPLPRHRLPRAGDRRAGGPPLSLGPRDAGPGLSAEGAGARPAALPRAGARLRRRPAARG